MEDSQGVTLVKDKEITRASSHLGLVLNKVFGATIVLTQIKLNKETNPLLLWLQSHQVAG
jgi:hypothetical protein